MAPKTRTVGWQPLTVKHDRALVAGGKNKSFISTAVRRATVDNEEKTFLRVSHKERWLVAGVSGYRQCKGGLSRRTSLIDELKQELVNQCGIRPTTPAGSNEAVTASRDTIEDMYDDEGRFLNDRPRSLVGVRGGVTMRKRYSTNYCKGRVIKIAMSATAPKKDPHPPDRRMVSIFCEDRNQLWLNADDVDWAMRYIHDQLQHSDVRDAA